VLVAVKNEFIALLVACNVALTVCPTNATVKSPSRVLDPYWSLIVETSEKMDQDYKIVAALVVAESNGHHAQVNEESAACMMQVVSGERIAGRPLAQELIDSPALCIKTGIKILQSYTKRLGGNVCAGIAAYNSYVTHVRKYGYKTKFFARVREVYRELWGVDLVCK